MERSHRGRDKIKDKDEDKYRCQRGIRRMRDRHSGRDIGPYRVVVREKREKSRGRERKRETERDRERD